MKIGKLLLVLGGVVLYGSAGAVSWDKHNLPTIALTANSIWCSTTTCNTTGLTGTVIKMTAYSTPNALATPNGNAQPDDTGKWVDAKIAMYGDGIGISNQKQSIGGTGEGSSSPQHAIDNRGVVDVLVIDFNPNNVAGQDSWDVSSFFLGWTCQMLNNTNPNATGSGICPTAQLGDPVNADAWLGGSGQIDFHNVSFSGGVPFLAGQTFTSLLLSPDVTGTGLRNNSDTGPGNTGSANGRYLVITGSLSGYTDAFKVKAIDATMNTPTVPGGQVPLPGSIPLVGLGLLTLAWVSRRRAVPIRR